MVPKWDYALKIHDPMGLWCHQVVQLVVHLKHIKCMWIHLCTELIIYLYLDLFITAFYSERNES